MLTNNNLKSNPSLSVPLNINVEENKVIANFILNIFRTVLHYKLLFFHQFDQYKDLKLLTMPGFDKMGAYQTFDSIDKEDESKSQCQSQLDETDNIEGMYFQFY